MFAVSGNDSASVFYCSHAFVEVAEKGSCSDHAGLDFC